MAEPDPQQPFSEVAAEARHTVERLGQLRSKAEQVTVTATSPDGAVTVTVNSGGVPTDLRITDDASGQSGARIAAQVLETMRKAQSRIADSMSEVMPTDDPELRDRILAVYHDRFPEPEGQSEPAESAWHRTIDDEQDDDSFLRSSY